MAPIKYLLWCLSCKLHTEISYSTDQVSYLQAPHTVAILLFFEAGRDSTPQSTEIFMHVETMVLLQKTSLKDIWVGSYEPPSA